MLSAGALIWIAIRPLIRTFGIVGAGFALTKADLFPVEASQGAGQIVLNIVMPCLLFSRIVPAFNSENVTALGPLFLVGFVYGFIGMIMSWVIKKFFWVPHRFRFGILVAGGWGNYGDIPTAIALGVTANAPFAGVQDQNLAVAYISALILVFFFQITLFPMGGHRLVAKDFDGPEVENDHLREVVKRRRQRVFHLLTFRQRFHPTLSEKSQANDIEAGSEKPAPEACYPELKADDHCTIYTPTDGPGTPGPASERNYTSCVTSPTPTVVHGSEHYDDPPKPHSVRFTDPPPSLHQSLTRRARYIRNTKEFMGELIKPAPLTVVFALPIALVNPLKALFVPPDAQFQPSFHPRAPDGQPPLAFILDTATFAGSASVPLGLICLGSALARLNVGGWENWARMPRGAIAALAIGKMIVTPVLGVLIVQGLVHGGLIDAEDKVLQFVCMIFAGLPTATTQVFLTQVYSPTGAAEHLSAFLIPQYIIMFISMTGLTVYALHYLF
ncbi:auxin efflux carrier [Amylostereum chailletii]|nr:auxin efflux carrier [Amylostereum chailletii]